MKDNHCQSTKRNGLIYGDTQLIQNIIQNIDSCPKIHNTQEIRLPNGVPSEIYLQLVNLPTEVQHSTVGLI